MPPNLNSNLVLGSNLSFDPKPQIRPTASSPRILVIGGGVIGLITSWVLLDRGYHVTIVSKEWASFTTKQRLTSQIAGALWEYPPAVCGSHTDTVSLRKSKRWCMIAYHIWSTIANDPNLSAAAGVKVKTSSFFFPYPLSSSPKQLSKFHELAHSGVLGLSHNPSLLANNNIDPSYGAVDAYSHLAPIIDTDRCMAWLMTLVASKGAVLHTESIPGDLVALEPHLLSRFRASVIVNATGLAAAHAAADKTVYPLRGALLRVINDGSDFPKIDSAMAVAADAAADGEIVFLVPRNDNILLLGGIAQKNRGTLDLSLDDEVIKRMRDRCERFLPMLKNARLDPEYPLAQGLRPCRGRNVRCEREERMVSRGMAWGRTGSRIVHSYGHGGAGWSLSFGCAEDVAGMIEEILVESEAEKMELAEREMGGCELMIRSRL